MLKPEQAKARLAEWQFQGDENRIAAEVKRLPAELGSVAEVALKLGEEEKEGFRFVWEAELKRTREAVILLDRLGIEERARIFATVSSQLAPAMEGAWQLLKTTPYQRGYYRKAFRAPRHPALFAGTLGDWIGSMASLGRRYREEVLTPAWLAAWAPHIDEGYRSLAAGVGPLLAAVLNNKGDAADEVFEILRQSLNNQHEIGAPGRHVYEALLVSNREEGWELIEKLLLAAQRQEGLRQAILERVDVSHPEAFRRMLRLILDHDLIRFSSVVRAVDVWFGNLWTAASGTVIKKMLGKVVEFLEDHAARDKALHGKDAEAAFLALWCAGTEDAVASVAPASKLLASKSVELRYVAVKHLVNLDLDVTAGALVPAIDDEDLRVALLAIGAGSHETGELAVLVDDERFERIERLISRVPEKPQKLKALVWPWTEITIEQSQVAACLLQDLGKRHVTRLIPYLSKLESSSRRQAVEKIIDAKPWDAATRSAVINLAGDAASVVRETALKALLELTLTTADSQRLEAYLTRKTGDLRRGILTILLKQDDMGALASADRLLAAKDANQRLAGLELLRLLTDAKRSIAACRQQSTAYLAARKKVGKEEQSHLDEIAKDKVAVATLDDALGLMNPADRTPVVAPRNLKVQFITPAAVACLAALDELVHKHRETTIKYTSYAGEREELLGNISWGFPSPTYSKSRERQRAALPLADVWLEWSEERDKKLRDSDGLELLRAFIWSEFSDEWDAKQWNEWAKRSAVRKEIAHALSGGQATVKIRYPRVVREIIDWLMFLSARDGRDYLLDAIESSYSIIPAEEQALLCRARKGDNDSEDNECDWRDAKAIEIWTDALSPHSKTTGLPLTPQQQVRHWRLMHWRDEPVPGARRHRVDAELLGGAYAAGAATLADVADHLLGVRAKGRYGDEDFDLLSSLTDRRRAKSTDVWLSEHPEVQELVNRGVARILELELSRGDAPTAATNAAYSISTLWGIETLRRILHALGKAEFKLGKYWRSSSTLDRRQTLTQLAKVTFPADGETPEAFAKLMKAAVREEQFPEERLLQLTFLAPQWTKCVEAFFDWENMSEGIYWFLAHMRSVSGLGENAAEAAGAENDTATEEVEVAGETVATDDDDSTETESPVPKPQKLSAWERLILERTPLTDAERNEGAIDVAWFRRTHEQLGDKRWQELASAARFAANASQARRAKFIAEVLLNRTTRKELVEGIKKKQLRDHVRLLGLLPLATGKKREADLVERCRILRDYRRYANQLSGLTKPSALRAWEIGMKNLAQTAGFADPLRLEWAVGADAVKDLAKGPVSVSKNGVTVTLSLNEFSKPEIAVRKADRVLKAIPPEIKKDKKVAELTARVTDLKRQTSAIRQSLETAMCRGDTFAGEELRQWCSHALLAPLLSRLVVIGEGIAGYPDKGGKALRDHRDKLEPVKPGERLRLAHAHDLLETNAWQDWQRECFRSERVQPFKQVFRELYVLTKQEKTDGTISRRYDGQQVQPRQALALFGSRGWNTQDGIFKVFHDLALTAHAGFQSGVTTPLEVEGWTLAGISFTKRDEWKPMKLSAVPPRLFSEVMRDLDLVVSVAHAGGVDPEASASTVEMRAGLLRETCSLLKLKNVRLKPTHAVIDGQLANYTVHLGSGVVHKMPGGSLCIVPVHAQHRGRLFLPFADDDPRTAEVVSKVLLLSRDHEIQDPVILEQIRR